MEYKNVTSSMVHIGEHRILEPGESVYLTEDDLKNPLIKTVIYKKGWLQQVVEEAVGNVINDEVENLTNRHPGPTTNNFNVNVEIPIKDKAESDEKALNEIQFTDRQQAIAEAVARAERNKSKTSGGKPQWNPMDDAAYDNSEEEYTYTPPKKKRDQYGNMEHDFEAEPKVHTGNDSTGEDDEPYVISGVNYIPHHIEQVHELMNPQENLNDGEEADLYKTEPKKTTKKAPKQK